ncbi:hypothetical protein ALC57_06872 [Trachymyrmex cornetzi]|uniref:Uncharacterized protein n=1 Tax=Trachymyrmex cornetzi TaxID=471704 RepID=A0A195E6Z2_9HYME|nr:hypothetical protein ALC57_06872 [Trachymyrmex cornetzi]
MGCLVRITERRRPWGWLRDRMRNDEDEDRQRERWFDLSFPHKGSEGMRSRATARGMKDQCHASYRILIARPVPIYRGAHLNPRLRDSWRSYNNKDMYYIVVFRRNDCKSFLRIVFNLRPAHSDVSDADGVRVGSSVIRLADEERLGTDVGYPYQEWCQCSLLCSLCYARLGPAPRRSSDGYRTLSSYSSPCLLGTPS